MTGFYMKCITGSKWVQKISASKPKENWKQPVSNEISCSRKECITFIKTKMIDFLILENICQ